MICNKNYANLRFYEEVNGRSAEFFICSECYGDLRRNDKFFLSDLAFHASAPPRASATAKVCPTCGATVRDFYETSLLGCSDCFETFRDEIKEAVREL
ncbi:MAG: hypothetical protein LBP79_06875 [Clostridiales bacterium]|jgi:protein arginine kinase activator|nr:hypothetical protein [Clostridiales bacterium]